MFLCQGCADFNFRKILLALRMGQKGLSTKAEGPVRSDRAGAVVARGGRDVTQGASSRLTQTRMAGVCTHMYVCTHVYTRVRVCT